MSSRSRNIVPLSVILFLVAMILSPPLPSQAQNSPNDYVNAHNDARSQVGVGPVSWDDTLVAYAQDYANQRANDCALEHSSGPYGENIAVGYGYDFTGLDAVAMWVSEKQYYDYDSNSCADGEECGHYTQVVWRDSTRLGCGRSECYNGDGWFIICSYDPPGNYNGERPY
ncbi:hypothetical protein Dimus_026333 [Dionaea muscipula]